MNKRTNAAEFYLTLKEKEEGIVHFFKRNGGLIKQRRKERTLTNLSSEDVSFCCYCFAEDAKNIVSFHMPSLPKLTSVKELSTVQLCCLEVSNLEIRRVISHLLFYQRKKISFWEFNKSTKSWDVWKKCSPGNWQNIADLIEMDESNGTDLIFNLSASSLLVLTICSLDHNLLQDEYVVNAAYCNEFLNEISCLQFNDSFGFPNVEKCILYCQASECVLNVSSNIKDEIVLLHLRKILINNNVVINEVNVPTGTIKQHSMDDILKCLQVILIDYHKSSGRIKTFCQSSRGKETIDLLLTLLNFFSEKDWRFEFKFCSLDRNLRLNSSTLRGLHILPISTSESSVFSLYSYLNKCRTCMGQQILKRWLQNPLQTYEEICQRQELTRFFVENSILREHLQDRYLRSCKRLILIIKRCCSINLSFHDVREFYLCLIKIQQLLTVIRKNSSGSLTEHFVIPAENILATLNHIVNQIEIEINWECYNTTGMFGFIKKNSTEIFELQESMMDINSSINDIAEVVAKKCGLTRSSIKIDQHDVYGTHFRITRREAHRLRHCSDICVHLKTQVSGVFFTTLQLQSLNLGLIDIKEKLIKIEKEILAKIGFLIRQSEFSLKALCELIGRLDVHLSFAELASTSNLPYSCPVLIDAVSTSQQIYFQEAYHPLLEFRKSSSCQPNNCVPNDVWMESIGNRFIIVTGPNMGGKSTFLRMIGCLVIMSQIGCFIPCKKAKLSIFDGIFVKSSTINDNLNTGRSSFYHEMEEVNAILRQCTDRSLVFMDEVGRGTSADDGFGLAYAICKKLIAMSCFAMFSTHMHQLTTLDECNNAVTNVHLAVENRGSGMNMLYKVRHGSCLDSQGIQVLEKLDIPQVIIDDAYKFLESVKKNNKSAFL